MTTPFRQALAEGLALARQGRDQEALALLEARLEEALAADDKRWIWLFAANVGIVAEHSGDPSRAERAYLAALHADDTNPRLHLALSMIYQQSGQPAAARTHFETSRALATESADESLLELLAQLEDKA